METIKKERKIVPLSEDIRQMVSATGPGKLEMMRFCMDHPKPYLLVDKKPVFPDISQDQLLSVFGFGTDRLFLGAEQFFRFGVFLKMGVNQLIALMLKSEWEQFFSSQFIHESDSDAQLKPGILNVNLAKKYIPRFNPNKDRIFRIIQKLPYVKSSRKTRSDINLLIEDMVKERYFLFDNRLINEFYPVKEYSESQLLADVPEARAKQYNRLKYLWKRRTTELEEKLYEGEKKKRANQNSEDLYYRTFGRLELQKMVLSYQVEKYTKALELKENNPELSFKDTLKKAIISLEETKKKTRELKKIYKRSLHCISGSLLGNTVGISQHEVINYKEEVKALLKKLFFLLHSDTCPVQNLSEEQKSGVNKLWMELMSSKDEFYSYAPDMLMWSLPDYDNLLSILMRACKILDINMEDLDVADRLSLMIRKGTSIEKIIRFLENDIEKLQLHLTNLEIIQDDYTNENKAQMYRIALEKTEAHKVKLNTEIFDFKKQIRELKDKIKFVFKRDLADNRNT